MRPPTFPCPWPPKAGETHQIVDVIVINQVIIIFIQDRQVRLIGPQKQVLPPHRVSQVKDQVLMEEGTS